MSTILVHQALHGYNDGHRLIASSLSLDAADGRVMLVMSDLSGPGIKPSDGGYLTGYPLEHSGKYVFSRTWAAPEMPRPGCVWTHSLIIDNADLAKLVSVKALIDNFYRPTGTDTKARYSAPVSLPIQTVPCEVDRTDRAEQLLQALYSFPMRQVVADAGEPLADEQLTTAIWMQQWPRLRRSFGFCTLSGMDRSGKGAALDLQFVPEKDHKLRSKFPSAVVAGGAIISDEILPLMGDLTAPSLSTLREFLKRTGGDVDGGRSAMLPLCELHRSLLKSQPPDLASAVSALVALDSGGRTQARAIRSLVTRQAMKSPGRVENVVFEFLLNTVEQLSDPSEQVDVGNKLGIELWRRSPHRFHAALYSEGVLANIASHALSEIKSDLLVSGLKANSDIVTDIVKRRPDIMKLPAFWNIPKVDDQLAEHISHQDAGVAIYALLTAGRVGPAATIINKVESSELAHALESEKSNSNAVLEWLSVLCCDLNKLASVLASGQLTKMSTLVIMAQKISPDDVPNSYGEDPWLIALRSASGSLGRSDEDFLAAFFLNRALGWKSRSPAELLQYSYTRVYRAFESQRFARDAEKLASSRLVRGSWIDWDNCSRLKETVVKKFIDYELEPEIFGRITDDVSLALSLIDEAANSKKGRAYLKRVYEALKRIDEAGNSARADYINDNLK